MGMVNRHLKSYHTRLYLVLRVRQAQGRCLSDQLEGWLGPRWNLHYIRSVSSNPHQTYSCTSLQSGIYPWGGGSHSSPSSHAANHPTFHPSENQSAQIMDSDTSFQPYSQNFCDQLRIHRLRDRKVTWLILGGGWGRTSQIPKNTWILYPNRFSFLGKSEFHVGFYIYWNSEYILDHLESFPEFIQTNLGISLVPFPGGFLGWLAQWLHSSQGFCTAFALTELSVVSIAWGKSWSIWGGSGNGTPTDNDNVVSWNIPAPLLRQTNSMLWSITSKTTDFSGTQICLKEKILVPLILKVCVLKQTSLKSIKSCFWCYSVI